MDMYEKFNLALWEKGDPNQIDGFATYRIASQTYCEVTGDWKIALYDSEGEVITPVLKGVLPLSKAKKQLFQGIGAIEIMMGGENNKQIVGLIVVDECVMWKS